MEDPKSAISTVKKEIASELEPQSALEYTAARDWSNEALLP